jgi:type II secretory pathway pseudopilin PulG
LEDNMKSSLKSNAGMSLVEATIILMVLAILTAVIAPSAADYVNDARQTKAKEDVEAIGTSILRLTRDTGFPCITKDALPVTDVCTGGAAGNKRELLTSSDAVGTHEPSVTGADYARPLNSNLSAANLNWAGATNEVADAVRDTMDNQLITNTLAGNAYSGADFTAGGGPRAGLGWRGAYLSGPVGLDPWGYAYQASVAFLIPASDATGSGEGTAGFTSDVVVVSAGQNGSIATPFGALATSATGDDVVYVVRGATR